MNHRQRIALEMSLYAVALVLGCAIFGWLFFVIVLGTILCTLFVAAIIGIVDTALRRRPINRWTWMYGPAQFFASDNRVWCLWGIITLVAICYGVVQPLGSPAMDHILYAHKGDPVLAQVLSDRAEFYAIREKYREPEDATKEQAQQQTQEPRPWPLKSWAIGAYCFIVLVLMLFPTLGDDLRRWWQETKSKTWQQLGGEATTVPSLAHRFSEWRQPRPKTPAESAATEAQPESRRTSYFWSSFWANMLAEIPSMLHILWDARSRRT